MQEVDSFIKEMLAVNKMKSLLPVEILEHRLQDVQEEINYVKNKEDIVDKKDFLEQLNFIKSNFDREIQKRNTSFYKE